MTRLHTGKLFLSGRKLPNQSSYHINGRYCYNLFDLFFGELIPVQVSNYVQGEQKLHSFLESVVPDTIPSNGSISKGRYITIPSHEWRIMKESSLRGLNFWRTWGAEWGWHQCQWGLLRTYWVLSTGRILWMTPFASSSFQQHPLQYLTILS